MIDPNQMGIAFGSISTGGSSLTPLIATSTSTFNIPAGDTSDHTILTLALNLAKSHSVFIMGSLNFKFSVANAGLHVTFYIDGVQVGPPGLGIGDDMLVNQTVEAQQFTFAFFQQVAAGSHTLTMHVAVALAAGAAAVQWYQMSAIAF